MKKLSDVEDFYKYHEKIQIPILYYIDEETGKKVYDLEEMTNEFESKLRELTDR